MTNPLTELFGEVKPRNEFSSSIMTIIMGHAGVGKTTLATSCKELGFTILVNFENRIGHIDETENLRFIPRSTGEYREDKICGYDEFLSFFQFVTNGKLKVNYIIIDTIDSMFEIFLKRWKPYFKDQRQAYNVVYEEMHDIFRKLKESGCNIIATSHVVNDEIIEKVTVSLNAKLRNKINNITDNIFYYEELENETRVLKLKSDNKVKCKLTTKTQEQHKNAEKEFVNPTWKDILEVING